MKFSILGPGFIGRRLCADLNGTLFGRDDDLTQYKHDVLIVAAPTGNRIAVNHDPDGDEHNCKNLIATVGQVTAQHIVYVSTVDVYPDLHSNNSEPSVTAPTQSYGKNRWLLEQGLGQLPNSHVVRLPSIVDPTIHKNILYDLKHQQWLDKINLDSCLQWYPLLQLAADIVAVIQHNIKFQNLVSEPIANRDLVSRYYPELLNSLSNSTSPVLQYNVCSQPNKYFVQNSVVWQNFDQYFSC